MSDALKLLLLFGFLSAIVVTVFIVVACSTRWPSREQAEVQHDGYVIRGRWFIGVTLFLLATFVATIPFFPYMSAASALEPAEQVPVIAAQFFFNMPDHFPLNRRIIFAVTSHDVNHGFGIYDPQDRLVAQTQAMPDYVNYLTVTFRQPGHYKVRCLEYCGVGHALMEKDFTVGNSEPENNPKNKPENKSDNKTDSNGNSNPFE
jgi:cytochrome c oxidase subunit 2